MEPHVKHRAVFMFVILFPSLLLLQYFGFDSMVVTGALAGITGGVSVILFPDPNR